MQNILNELKDLLQQDNRHLVDGKLLKTIDIGLALQHDPSLLKRLLSQPSSKNHFFKEIEKDKVFDKIKFQKFESNKAFLPDSFTSYKNKIGLIVEDEFVKENKEVVFSWPYKDCVLVGGESRAYIRRNEVIWNEILAHDETDRLLNPRVLSYFKRYFRKKSAKVTELKPKENFIIKGNNLLPFCTLKKIYTGKTKLIYIAPSYNTVEDSFGYKYCFNYSTWLIFIHNRLEKVKALLAVDSVFFISIDINEQAYLKVLYDEIFGSDNFVGEIIWETATVNNTTQISVEHEYVICYANHKEQQDKWQIKSEKAQVIQKKYKELKGINKNKTDAIERDLRNWLNGLKKSYKIDISGVSHYSYVDKKGVFYPDNSASTKPGGYTFDILHPVTKRVYNKPDNGYIWPETTFWDADKTSEVLWGEDENSIPKIKKRFDTATELLKGSFYEDNRRSTKTLTKMMGSKVFDNPKSINPLKKIIKFTTKDNDIVLDYFDDRGSTEETLLEIIKTEKTNRKFIICEQLDYVESVTVARVQKCLKHTKSKQDLKGFWKRFKTNGLIRWSVKTNKFEQETETTKDAAITTLKNLLYEALDKNQMNVPLSEIADIDYNISKEDKAVCNLYFNQKNKHYGIE